MSIIDSFLRKREARERSPDFQREMAQEMREFNSVIDDFEKTVLKSGYNMIINPPLKLFSNSLKTLYKKKYGAGKFTVDSFKIFIGKDGVLHSGVKLVASAAHVSGKSIKVGIRKLLAI